MRVLAFIVGAIAVGIAVVVVLGLRLPREHRIEASTEISAPPLAVWTTISDPAAGPTWRSDVKRVEMLDQRRWREYGKTGSVIYRLDKNDPMHSRVVVIDDPGLPFTGKWTYVLEAQPNGETQLTITEDATVWNPVYRFVAHYVIGERTTLDRYLGDLKKSFAYGKGKAAA